MKNNLALAFSFLALPSFQVLADYDGTVDPTFNCPALTTCRQVCVATFADCPFEMLCGSDLTLCPDGTCSESCEGHEETPCAYECAPVACNKVDDFHDNCQEKYGALWDAEAVCGEAELDEEIFLFNYTEPGFIVFYVLYAAAPLLLLLWCAYNQRVSPVPGSCKTMELEIDDDKPKTKARLAWQTGYKYTPVGVALHVLSALTMTSVYVMLLWLVIQYYIQQESILWSWVTGRFEDEVQVLLCFILVWMYGLFYLFSLKFPHSLKSVHMRRCQLGEADFVAIAVKRLEKSHTEVTFSNDHLRTLKASFASFHSFVHAVMTAVFSDQNTFGCERTGDASFVFLPVLKDKGGSRYVSFEFRRYNLGNIDGTEKFYPGAWTFGKTVGDLLALDNSTGLSIDEVEARRRVVGVNKVEMKRPNFLLTLKREFSTPFYTYQGLMVLSWLPLYYYYMAFTWAFVILVGAISVSIVQNKNDRNLYRLTHIEGEVEVLRAGKKQTLPHDNIVPGDIVTVVPGTAYCDMVLLESTRVLTDESALTGEANPVGKVAVDSLMAEQSYDVKTHKRNTIFAGTTILESENSRALVLKTSSYTARGELIRDIFSYRRNLFKFDAEVPIVITILFFYAIFGWTMAFYWTGEIFVFGWFYGIYVVAGCLPPLLPTVFTVSVGISDDRLSKKNIACTSSESILVAGKVQRAFFDKTGTITKQGLDFISARGKSAWIDESKGFSQEMSVSLATDQLKLGMACCHHLTQSQHGDLIGNPVDRVMFKNSRAKLQAKGNETIITDKTGKVVRVVRIFDFDHYRMTQSVIVQDVNTSELFVFCKGSGEAIQALCKAETLPSTFESALRESAKSGLYQISMASKSLDKNVDVNNLSRDEVEKDLSFEGVINFKNTMRENSAEVMKHLQEGEIVSAMVTGDNVLTGICIAKEAGILSSDKPVLVGCLENNDVVWRRENNLRVQLPEDNAMANVQLAVTGAAWSQLCATDPKRSVFLQDFVKVFGRCTPHDKVAVVQSFARAGHITLMCGDGGNDCGALKAAHVGVALSDAEASIVAPFSSLDKDIASVVEVVREGRCALGSALASYKFVIMYGQILTINQLTAAYFNITFSEWGWVFMDGVWTITLSFALPLAQAAKRLAPKRPTASVLGLHTLSSTLGVLVINFIFLVIAFVALNQQDWYQCRKWEGTDVSNLTLIGDNYETQVLWLVTGYQVVSSATVFNFGYEFRRAWIRNWFLVTLLTGYTAIHFYITLVPGELSCFFRINCLNEYTFDGVFGALDVQNDFHTTIIPESFRHVLLVIMISNVVTNIAWDYLVVNTSRQHLGTKRRQQAALRQENETKTLDIDTLALSVKVGRILEEDEEEVEEP